MKTKNMSYEGLPLTRINYSNSWCYITKWHDTAIAVMYSYETPIVICKCKRGRVYVELNNNAYKYSRTTSKHLSQWLTILRLFTIWGSKLPRDFRNLPTNDYNLTYGECEVPINNDDLEIMVVNETTLRGLCKLLSATKSPTVGLVDIASM